jgi:hypothetical protein
MKKIALLTLVTLFVLGGFSFVGQSTTAQAQLPKILEFDTMVGVQSALTGAQNPIRGINGGGLPWRLDSAKGELKVDGKLEIKVEGLVLAAGANEGINPIASFRAIVSCITSDGSVQNVITDAFPATTGPADQGGGNSKIETVVDLPQPCVAPIIFVTSPAGAWFAATGK